MSSYDPGDSQNPDLDFDYRVSMPQYSQVDQKWGFQAGSERSMCGIICLKACLDHYARFKQNLPEPRELFENLKLEHGWDARIGITHAAEIAVLGQHGLLAWRRDWQKPETE